MEIRAFYDAYFTTFVALCRGDRDDQAALLDHYAVPLLMSGDTSGHLRTADEVLEMVRHQVADARAAGFDRSEMSAPRTTVINSSCAWFEADFVRRRADGSEITAFSGFYLINDLPEGRRITTVGFRSR